MPVAIKQALVLSSFGQPVFDILSKYNIQVHTRPDLSSQDQRGNLLKELEKSKFDVVFISNNVNADAEFFKAASPKLKCVIFCGAGIDNIDVKEATAHNVAIMNSPNSVTIPTAESCCLFILG